MDYTRAHIGYVQPHVQLRNEVKWKQTLIENLLEKLCGVHKHYARFPTPYRFLHVICFQANSTYMFWTNGKVFDLSDCWQETAGDGETSWKEWPAIKQPISTAKMAASQNTQVCLIHERRVMSDNKVPLRQTLKRTGGIIFVWDSLCGDVPNCYCSGKQNFCSKLALKRHHKTVPPSFIASPRLLLSVSSLWL